METIWFCLVAIMIVAYVLLDGFDLGAGIIHLGVARSDDERRIVLESIGPVWNGNEVFLIAAGGTLYFAFPALYASAFSGFYLPLMIVLWLLVLRGIAIEFRNHIDGPVWAPLWDAIFAGSSALLAIFFGAALGNVIRGVPLDASGFFFEPLWTNFRLGPPTGILDWYTILSGLTAYFALTMHGALWVAYKTTGELRRRARRVARWSWAAVVVTTALLTWATFRIQPQVPTNFSTRPWGFVFPALALGGLLGLLWLMRDEHNTSSVIDPGDSDLKTFAASSVYLSGMLASAIFGVYPYVLPANTNPAYALTVHNAAAPAYGLRVGLAWWIFGMALVSGYFVFVYRHSAGRLPAKHEHDA